MASNQEDIASQLLHSTDARIAEAAKRVFSSTFPSAAINLTALSAAAAPSASGITNPVDESLTLTSVVDHCDRNHSSAGPNFNGADEHTADIGSGAVDFVATNDDVTDDLEEGDKKASSTERLKRSRERNRMHARKTRQRKKEHMQKLQNRADELKLEQIRLKQAINEKNTASILVGLFQTGDSDGAEPSEAGLSCDPQVEGLLKRTTEDIPDASKIPELPALILPGQHNGKRKSTDGEVDLEKESMLSAQDDLQEDGIDYALLGKDRSSCTPAELDQIRRERNRMHAKRTRDRKRIFMEEMEVMIKQLEDENSLLQDHINNLNAYQPPTTDGEAAFFPQAISPELGPMSAPSLLAAASGHKNCEDSNQTHSTKGDFLNQIESLLAAAGSFQKKSAECEINAISCAESDVTASTNHSDHNSFGEEEEDDHISNHILGSHPSKRQRLSPDLPSSVPTSITTTSMSLE